MRWSDKIDEENSSRLYTTNRPSTVTSNGNTLGPDDQQQILEHIWEGKTHLSDEYVSWCEESLTEIIEL